ncbi:MAG TPA: ABC transporter substrate-binding protein [Bacillales bacterium]|nr:ABC transporter substrate-binding protein [Bacillales bacterium]
MKMRSFKLLSIMVLALCFVLSACSSNGSKQSTGDNGNKDTSSKDNSDNTTDTSSKKVTIVYAHGKDDTQGTAKTIAAFEKKYPNITVKEKIMPNDSGQQHDQYVTAFNAHSSEIDVFDMDVVWPAEFAQAGYTLPLDRFIQKDGLDMSQYNKGALSASQFDGKQWAMPKYIDVGMLFYRKDLVKNPPKTWEELIADAKKYQGQGGTKYGYAMQAKQYEGLVCNASEFIASYGGKFIDKNGNVVVNSPDTIQGLKEMKKIVNSGFVPSNITTFTEPETENAFIQGQTVMARNWPYMWFDSNDKSKSKVVGKVGVAPLPAGDAGSASSLGGWQTGINKYSKHAKEAWEFLKFMTGPEGEKINAIYGGKAPTVPSLYSDPEVLKANPFFKQKGFQEALNNAVSRPVAPNYQKISGIIQIEVSKMLAGQQSAEQAAKNMETKMKEAMSK